MEQNKKSQSSSLQRVEKFYPNQSLKKALELEAKKTSSSKSSIVCEALAMYLKAKK